MKLDFHIKLLIGLLAIFAVVFGIFIFYEPVKVKILAWKLQSYYCISPEGAWSVSPAQGLPQGWVKWSNKLLSPVRAE